MNDILEVFYSKEYEIEINRKLLENNYTFPKNSFLKEYIVEVLDKSIDEYLDWIDTNYSGLIPSFEDAVQFSRIDEVGEVLVDKMLKAGDTGFDHCQIGELLLDDGIVRKKGALTKYGENHVKTSQYLGFVFSVEKYYYVSCLGYILKDLSENEKNMLYSRVFMRTRLFRIMYLLGKKEKVSLKKVFGFLSDSTYLRRKSNIKSMFNKLKDDKEYDWDTIINQIEY